MNRSWTIAGVACATAAALSLGYWVTSAKAGGVPQTNTLVYSGTLLDNGQPDNEPHFIILKLWLPASASPACSTIPNGDTQLVNGRFSIPLDASCVEVIHDNADVEVEVVVDGASMGKKALAAVPYALEADSASNPTPGSAIDALVPPGAVTAFAGVVSDTVSPPQGWLLCDGSEVSRTTYARLFAALGTTAGAGDGATTFNLPDYRGYFLRGLDQGAGRDPGAPSRAPMANGGSVGDEVGTVEDDEFLSNGHGVNDGGHAHGQQVTANAGGCPGSGTQRVDYDLDSGNACGYPQGVNTYGSGANVSIQQSGGAETRPINAAVNYLIKF